MFGKWDKSWNFSGKGRRLAYRKSVLRLGKGKGRICTSLLLYRSIKITTSWRLYCHAVINDAQDVRQIFEWYFYSHRISSGRI